MMSPTGVARRCGEVPPWWAEKFQVADNFFQEEPPFAAFWPTWLFRLTAAVWVIMVTEMLCISAKISFVPLIKIVSCTDHRLSFIGQSEPRIRPLDCADWTDEIQVTWTMGFLNFDP